MSETVEKFAETYLTRPTIIFLIIICAFLLSRLLRRLINRFGKNLVEKSVQGLTHVERRDSPKNRDSHKAGRAKLRAKTMISVISSLSTVAIWIAAGLIILNQFDFNLAPLFAGAGVVGVALGFGAQSIVADFLSGVFMLFEDQFGIGDVINTGEVTGTVEGVSLRTTTLRDVNGTVWYIRNSEIKRIANKSQLWSRAVLDIDVAYDTDLRRAEGIIQRVADDLWKCKDFTKATIIDPPEVWGIENLGVDGVTIRLVVKTDPAEQFIIARELRLRIKESLDEAGIEMPYQQRTIWLRDETDSTPRTERPTVKVAPLRTPDASNESAVNP